MSKVMAKKANSPHILIVDDEDSVLYTLEAVLKPEGYVVSKATCTDEALAVFQTGDFDLNNNECIIGENSLDDKMTIIF